MRIVRLQAEGFKRIVAVDITPEGDLVEVRGNNENGKSSVLDAIFAALGGAEAAPERPVRDGEEAAVIRLDLGELVVTRYFTAAGTTGLKVTTPDGAAYGSAQTMLDKLVGKISFDPLAFRDLKPAEQADELRKLVELVDPETGEEVDLAAIAAANKADFAKRRDVNRDAHRVKAQIDGMGGIAHVPDPAPDRDAILASIESAAEKNAERERERARHDNIRRTRDQLAAEVASLEATLALARAGLEESERDVAKLEASPIGEPIDLATLSAELANADRVAANIRHNAELDRLKSEFDALKVSSSGYSSAMQDRDALVARALASAKMPVEGLTLETNEDGELSVLFNGVPFSQASDAQRLRVSVAVAMAANPELRVVRLKDASLLDRQAIATLREMAGEADFQIWAEFVGDEGPGIIMEAGEVRGADRPEPLPKPRTRRPADDAGKAEAEGDDKAPASNEPSPTPAAAKSSEPAGLFAPEEAPPARRPQALTEFRSAPRK